MKVLAFSGGCFSGKTTAINAMKHIFVQHGIETHVGSEIIRNKPDAYDIDALRSDPNKYLAFESDVIRAKIDYEQKMLTTFNDDCIVLLDRALTDSYMYLTQYIDINGLYDANIEAYLDLRRFVEDAIAFSFMNIYTHVIEFKPLSIDCYKSSDTAFRPKRINTLKYIEYDNIHKLNSYYNSMTDHKCKYIKTSVDGEDNIDFWAARFLQLNNI